MAGYVWGIPQHLPEPAPAWRRWRPNWTRLTGALAAAAGHTLRVARRLAVNVPGVAGPLLMAYGAWLAWSPAGFVVAGAFLLWLDRRSA